MLIGNFINLIITFTTYIIFWWVLITSASGLLPGNISNWNIGEAIVLLGFAEFAFSLNSLSFFGTISLSDKIAEQGLENDLVLPANPLILILARETQPIEGFSGLILALFLIFGSIIYFRLNFSLFGFIVSVFVLIFANAIFGYIDIVFIVASFWFGKMEALEHILSRVYVKFIRIPLNIFSFPIIIFFIFIYPLFYLATFPAMLTLGFISLYDMFIITVIIFFLFIIWDKFCRYLWNKGLENYQPVNG